MSIKEEKHIVFSVRHSLDILHSHRGEGTFRGETASASSCTKYSEILHSSEISFSEILVFQRLTNVRFNIKKWAMQTACAL